MVTSMMVNFLLICIALISIDRVNPTLAGKIKMVKNPIHRKIIGWAGILVIAFFLAIHIYKDLNATVDAWYFHSTLIWGIVMALASLFLFFSSRTPSTLINDQP